MELKDLFRTLARRWFLTVPVLVVAILVSGGLWNTIGASYQARGTIVLLPPENVVSSDIVSGVGRPVDNPLLYLDGLTNARDIVVSSVSSDPLVDEVESRFDAKVVVAPMPDSSSPMILLQVTANSKQSAIEGLQQLAAKIPPRVDALQLNLAIGSRNQISIAPVSVDAEPTVSHKRQIEYVGGALVTLVAGGFLAIAVLDVMLGRRRTAGGETHRDEEAPDEPGASGDPDRADVSQFDHAATTDRVAEPQYLNSSTAHPGGENVPDTGSEPRRAEVGSQEETTPTMTAPSRPMGRRRREHREQPAGTPVRLPDRIDREGTDASGAERPVRDSDGAATLR